MKKMKNNMKPTPAMVRGAVTIIKAHLDNEWISAGCEQAHSFGCASCQAVRLKKELDSIAGWAEGEKVDG